MRGYVERLEEAQYSLPDGVEAGYEEVMDSYAEELDNAREKSKEQD